jgi:MFS transporter, MHS family, proline/betaine transporter
VDGARDHRRELPAGVRVTGSSLGYKLCMALFGGTTPVVTVYLIKVTHTDLAPTYYLMTAAAVSLAVALGLDERPLA